LFLSHVFLVNLCFLIGVLLRLGCLGYSSQNKKICIQKKQMNFCTKVRLPSKTKQNKAMLFPIEKDKNKKNYNFFSLCVCFVCFVFD